MLSCPNKIIKNYNFIDNPDNNSIKKGSPVKPRTAPSVTPATVTVPQPTISTPLPLNRNAATPRTNVKKKRSPRRLQLQLLTGLNRFLPTCTHPMPVYVYKQSCVQTRKTVLVKLHVNA